MSRLRALLDVSPISQIALALMREATGRDEPLAALAPTRPAALRRGRRIGFWSLAAGAGSSTVAALLAHRSAAGGEPPLLVDLDRWVPSLALRAGLTAANVTDALLQPGREVDLVSRWSAIPFLPGAPSLHATFDGERLVSLVNSCAAGRAAVLDLGSGADSLDPAILSSLDRLCLVAGTRSAQLQAVFCAAPLLGRVPCAVGLVVVGAGEDDAARVAERVGFPLLAAIPYDPYLADDAFATRAPTLRAVDALLRALA
jgi:MinD-like ATPase involved in chromosome partitioning or flagellar assembly